MTSLLPRHLPQAAVLLGLLIEKKLRDVEGVETVSVLLDEGVVQLGFAERNGATFEDLQDAVSAAGFKLVGLKVEVRGRIEAGDDGKILVAAPDLRLRLVGDPTDEPPSGRVTRFGTVDGIASELPDLLVEERPSHPGVTP